MSALTITLGGPGLEAFTASLQAMGTEARREVERGLICLETPWVDMATSPDPEFLVGGTVEMCGCRRA